MAERLDVPLLALLGLIPNEADFNRKGVRINTANLYKQQKFNLLREENEGYSGLINELLGRMGPEVTALYAIPFDEVHNWQTAPVKVVEQERAHERNKRARGVMRNISALIGYFDLDPNRVLDIILDVFASNVVLHWPFFLALLSASPWARGRQDGKATASSSGNATDLDAGEQQSQSRIGEFYVDALKGKGSATCAQLLGFKFDYYQQQDTREDVPNELYLMSALLIKEGFVRFADLWTHLSPTTDGMKQLQTLYTAALKDKASNARGNALTMAAPLADDEATATTATGKSEARMAEEDAAPVAAAAKEPPNQILGLLKALLAIGQLEHALFVIGLHPWLMGAFPKVTDLYTRLLRAIIQPAYSSSISPATLHPVFADEHIAGPKMRFDVRKQALLPAPAPRLVPTASATKVADTAQFRFVYAFGDDWRKGLPVCSSADDVSRILFPLLRLLGVHLHRDITLFQQICRLGRAALRSESSSEELRTAWIDVVRFHLFPAISLTSGNSGLVNELWSMLRVLPYTARFSLYGEWKTDVYRNPETKYRQLETEKDAKGILKRISKDNTKLSGRALAKASHANPLIFFTVALNQVQVYDNMIPHIVECAKYLTLLEYDVFSFNLIDALSNPEKERTKQDGTNISLWLKSLASFTGTLYRRYHMMDPTPVLQYIANQLKANNTKDLIIIRELILKTSGIEPLANLSDKQIAALSGGRLLRQEAMLAAGAGPGTIARQGNRRAGARLMEALKDNSLAVALLILIAQQRQVCIHLVPEQDSHLRYLGNLADSCQEVLFQYVEFLYSHLDPAAYTALVPSLKSLCVRFAIEPSIAFHIARPRLLFAMKQADEAEAATKLRAELLAGRARASPQEGQRPADEVVVATTTAASDEDIVMPDGDGQTLAEPAEAQTLQGDAAAASAKPVWRTGMQEAVDAADAILSDEVKEILGSHFFATFWQLSLADIQVPTERYEQEMKLYQELMKEIEAIDGKKSGTYHRHQDSVEQLRAELKERTLAHQATRRRLAAEKDHWFADNGGTTRSVLVHQMLQQCILPRALLSPTDAMFAGKFIRLVHLQGARNFASITLYDRIFIEHIAPVIFSCTENEANSYARFLQTVLDDLMPWYKSEQLFTKEAIGQNLPGFQLRWADRRGGEEIPKEALCTHDQFKGVLRKWHDFMTAAFKSCLTSADFMRIRNAITVMNRIAHHYPLFDAHGRDLMKVVGKLTTEEDRGSLKVLGQGLLATLKKRQPEWLGKPKKAVVPRDTQTSAEAATSSSADSSTAATVQSSTTTADGAPSAPQETPAAPTAKTDGPSSTSIRQSEQGRKNDERSSAASRASSIPTGPRSAASANPSDVRPSANDSQDRAARRPGPNDIPARPALSSANSGRQASNSSLPTRPSRDDSRADERRGAAAAAASMQQQQREQLPPTGPRRDTRGSRGPAGEVKRDVAAASGSVFAARPEPSGSDASISAARRAALETMNAPRASAPRDDPPSGPSARAKSGSVAATNERERDRRGDGPSNHGNAPSRGTSPSRNGRSGTAADGRGSRGASPRPSRGDADDGSGRRDDRDRSEYRDRRDRDARELTRDRERERDRDRDRDRERERDRERDRDREDRRRAAENRDQRRPGADRSSDEDRDYRRPSSHREDPERSGPPSTSASRRDGVDAVRSTASTAANQPVSAEDATAAAYGKRREQNAAVIPINPRGNGRDRPIAPSSTAGSQDPPPSSRPDLIRPSGNILAVDDSRDRLPRDSQSRRDYPIHPRGNDRHDDRTASASGGLPPAPSRREAEQPASQVSSGLKRSLADRLAASRDGQTSSAASASQNSKPPSRGTSPRATGGRESPRAERGVTNNANAGSEGPDAKRVKINRNRFGPRASAVGGEDTSSGGGGRVSPSTPTGPAGGMGNSNAGTPLRSVSITGSAARERERRESQGRVGGESQQERGYGADARRRRGASGGAAPGNNGGSGGGRDGGDRMRDRSRRRAGEE